MLLRLGGSQRDQADGEGQLTLMVTSCVADREFFEERSVVVPLKDRGFHDVVVERRADNRIAVDGISTAKVDALVG